MKNYFFLALLAIVFASCRGNKEQVFQLDDLLVNIDQYIDQPVQVYGKVTHVCKHSGMKCFIEGNSGETSMQINAGDEIGQFSQDLVDAEILVKGVIREHQIPKEDIDDQEQSLLQTKEENPEEAGHCDTEMKSVEKMRQWMKDHGKDYYAIYYMDGTEYKRMK